MQRLPSCVGALAILLPLRCDAHWRLTKPVPRAGGVYENNPLPPQANTQEEWVCRHARPNPSVEVPTIQAGSTTGIVYGTGAIGHVGDCSVYISYDTERPRRKMRWVKIANLPDCRQQINQEVPIVVPSVLPEGDAVLRWDQYAIHQVNNNPGFIEWFIQCADVKISSASERGWDSFNSFSIIDNDGKPAYPSEVERYRNPVYAGQGAPNEADFWMTGPACVDGSINQCELTAPGTKGYTGFGGEGGASGPSGPATSRVPATAETSPAPGEPVPVKPTLAPSTGASRGDDAMCCYDAGCATYGTSFCNGAGTWCSQSEESCKACGGTLCSDPTGAAYGPATQSPGPTPAPELSPSDPAGSGYGPAPAAPAPAPATPSPNGGGAPQCCYSGGCSSYGSALCNAAGTWCSESQESCATCGGSLCHGVSLLSGVRGGRQKFLRSAAGHGHSLVQADAAVHRVSVHEAGGTTSPREEL